MWSCSDRYSNRSIPRQRTAGPKLNSKSPGSLNTELTLRACQFKPVFADSTRRPAIFTEQVIDRQGRPWAKSAKIGCSADQVYSHRRQYADNCRPSCSCAAKSAGRMASNIATGALSRTHALPAGGWCSGTCCIWVRSRHAGTGVAAVDRGFGGWRRATADTVAVSGRVRRGAAGGCLGGRRQIVGIASGPAAAVRCVLAGADAVARAAARSVLVEAAGSEPQRDALG